MKKHNLSGTMVLLILGLNMPSFAAGDLQSSEAKIQAKLQADYEAGRIDAERYSALQSNLDQIKEQESELRSRGGMTPSATSDMMKKLDDLSADMSKTGKESSTSNEKKSTGNTQGSKDSKGVTN
jgi:hypothetical protein